MEKEKEYPIREKGYLTVKKCQPQYEEKLKGKIFEYSEIRWDVVQARPYYYFHHWNGKANEAFGLYPEDIELVSREKYIKDSSF